MKYIKLIKNIHELLPSLQAMWNTRVNENKHHLQLAGRWLLYSQTINNDGGYAHSYSLYNGWEKSYPETTGYIIPTMLSLGKYLNDDRYTTSALKAGKWLLEIQQPDGSYYDLSGQKQIFDTGQILEGLLALYKKTYDEKYIQAAIKAGNFLIGTQDADGKWTQFSYNKNPHSYYTRVSAHLLRLYEITHNDAYKTSAEMNLLWTMKQQKENGYFNFMSFSIDKLSYLHTIIYVLEGLLDSYKITQNEDIYACVQKTVDNLIQIQKERDFILYSQYDENWQYPSTEKCLTGLAQWAKILLDLFTMTEKEIYFTHAVQTIHYLKSKQIQNGSKNILGALPGSIPLWGSYFGFSFNNWAVKFYIDALLRLDSTNIPLWKEQEIFVGESFSFNRDIFYLPGHADLNDDYLRIIENVIKNFPLGSTLVDIGCGEGHILKNMQTRLHSMNFVGIEPTFLLKSGIVSKKCTILRGNIYSIPLPDNSADIVLIKEVLQHIAFFDIALKEIRRISKNGTRVIIIDRNPISGLGLLKWIMEFTGRWMYSWDSPFREKWYTTRQWLKMLKFTGDIENIFHVNIHSKKIFHKYKNRFFVFIVKVKK